MALLALLLALGGAAWLLDTGIGHRFLANRIAGLRPANGLRYSVARIDGSIYSDATLVGVRIADPAGAFFAAPRAHLVWSPLRWFHHRLDITELTIPRATLARLPRTRPTGRHGPILPGFDIRIGRLAADRLTLGPALAGTTRVARLLGRADVRSGRALVDLAAEVAGTDTVRVKLDAEPDRNRFDLAAHVRGGPSGVLAHLAGIARPLAVDVDGRGSWRAWSGTAVASAGNLRIADLRLGNRAGAYTLNGTLAPSSLLRGKLQRLTAGRILVNGGATLADRQLAGTLSLRAPALAVEGTGALDLAASAYRRLRVSARLLRPSALFPNMSGNAIGLRLILDGAFSTARFDYRLTADRFAFDRTGFEQARAAGSGRLGRAPVAVPVRFTAARVTGVGDVAGGILRNLSVAGTLDVTAREIAATNLLLRSDKLSGRINLLLDLRTGRYEVGLNGALGRYLIPGLGVVDVTSRLRVVPGANGHGTRIVGTGEARVLRLDNAFFRSLAGGLPRIVTALERTPDGVLHFSNLRLSAPSLALAGNGFRRRDGSFHFEGAGRQANYGPLTLKLDGRIERPTLDLVFARPNAALGLRNVVAHLDPSASGFTFAARGDSRLGPFAGEGAILLPKGGTARIQVARLDVTGTRAAGALDIVPGGFQGRLAVAGGGISGELLLRPADAVQRIEAHLDLAGARLADLGTLRRGRIDLVSLLDPSGTSVEATLRGAGLRRGALAIGRFAANVSLRGGTGTVRASIAGTRGRALDIQTVTEVTPDRFSMLAQGTLDRRPLRFLSPAVLSREGDGWRLAATRLSFAGGEATVSGHLSEAGIAVDASLARMPLSILDIGYPGLGLGGNASGTIAFANAGGAPTGRIDMTVRGLTRSGLVLSSRPIDLGVSATLQPGKVAARAVVATGGQTVGRAQMLLSPLPGGDLAAAIAQAPLFAQLRYSGPADTLWRLTGIELFDLSGPVAIGADVRGRLARPEIRGVVQARGATIESATTGTVLTNIQANGRFNGSRLVLDRFDAAAGKGGRVTGTGAFDLAAANGFGIDVNVQANDALLINRDDIAAAVTGPLSFKSDGSGGLISGDVRLVRSRYRLGQATAAGAVPQLNIREINVPGGDDDDEPAVRRPWKLDVRARAPGALSVSGLGLTSEWSADLKIGGVPSNPAITGRADLIRGDYEFAGREFEIDRGLIRFGGEVPANPSLDITANADSTGLNATIRVTGQAQRPEIAFTSVPALPQDELLSRLLFGTSITNLSAPEALQLAAAVAALQDGGNGINPINAVRRAAGLDRLRILPADPQTGQQTSVAAGKYITRRLFAEIITDGQGYSATQLEFQVTRWLSVLSSISTLGRQSANVRVSKDY
ncbi:translocation/assembly module TamB domain-containing protein [Sphingomonas aracearum]|uniref:Translocation/assembly module TamB n=1 Tax=Sphingomonas aracearum TaxID=2283317 RepID=A0A369VZK6_9SPHN|nr:translocation/assembly module TamB [Sphingomonas aracearum]RDE05251.1 translocation/assembly module TamB [Sphingomonas aracearum]